MAFSTTLVAKSVFGNKKVRYGTWSNTPGTTGGGVPHELSVVEFMSADVFANSTTTKPSINVSALPYSTSATIPIVVLANTIAGTWMAIGY